MGKLMKGMGASVKHNEFYYYCSAMVLTRSDCVSVKILLDSVHFVNYLCPVSLKLKGVLAVHFWV